MSFGVASSAQEFNQDFPGLRNIQGGQCIRLKEVDLESIDKQTKDKSHDGTASEATANKWLDYARQLESNPTADANYHKKLIAKEVELLERALKVKERLLGLESEKLIPILESLGRAQAAGSSEVCAESCYKRAISIAETKRGKDHKSLIPILAAYEGVLWQRKKYAAAEPVIRQYAILCAKYGYPPESGYRYNDAETLTINKIALCLLRQDKKLEEAEKLFSKALARSKTVTPSAELKESFFHHALDAYERHADIPDAADSLIGLAEIARKKRRLDQAEKLAKRAIVAYRLSQGMDNWTILNRVEFRDLMAKVAKDRFSSEPLSEAQLNNATRLWMTATVSAPATDSGAQNTK